MFWYIVISVAPLLIAPLINSYYKTSINENKNAKKTYLFWCGFIILFFIAFRNKDLGSVDSQNYYNNWVTLRDADWEKFKYIANESNMETGYLFMIFFISKVFYYPQFVFVLSGLLFVIAICKTVYDNSKDVILSMVLYVCLGMYIFMVQGLRQSLSISLCLLSISCIKKRKFIPFLLYLIPAFLFHRTSIVFLPMYFLYGFNFSAKTKWSLAITAIVLVVLSPLIARIANQFLDREYKNAANTGAMIASAIYGIIIVLAFIFLGERNTDRVESFFIVMTVIGGAFYLSRYVGAQALERISFYFIAGQIIVLPSIISKFDDKSKTVINVVVCILAITLFLYRIYTSYTIPYRFFWGV